MRSRTLILFATVLLSPVNSRLAYSQTPSDAALRHVFPQVADGRFPDGTSFRSTLMVLNADSAQSGQCRFRLRGLTADLVDPDGNHTSGALHIFSIAPGGWQILRTTGESVFSSGYASLECDTTTNAMVLYSFFAASGEKLSEATVFSSVGSPKAVLIADKNRDTRYGLAIANDSDAAATYKISVTFKRQVLSPRPPPNYIEETQEITIPARTSLARFVDELARIQDLSIRADFYSTSHIEIETGNTDSYIIGLRFTGSVFTTIPPAVPMEFLSETQNVKEAHVFPLIAHGRLPDGSFYESSLFSANPRTSPGSDMACAERVTGFKAGFGDTNDNFTFFLPEPESLWRMPAAGIDGTRIVGPTGEFSSGYATFECAGPVFAYALYSFFAQDGTKLSEATVFSAPEANSVRLLVDQREPATRLGIAMANTGPDPANLRIILESASGQTVAETEITLRSESSWARFLDELLTMPADFVGIARFESNTESVHIMGLRFTGTTFTTIPPTPMPQ